MAAATRPTKSLTASSSEGVAAAVARGRAPGSSTVAATAAAARGHAGDHGDGVNGGGEGTIARPSPFRRAAAPATAPRLPEASGLHASRNVQPAKRGRSASGDEPDDEVASPSDVEDAQGSSSKLARTAAAAAVPEGPVQMVLQCLHCHAILADTASGCFTDEQMRAVVCSAASTRVKHDRQEVRSDGADEPDRGCTFTVCRCECGAAVGRVYRSTNCPRFDAFRGKFTLLQEAVQGYCLGIDQVDTTGKPSPPVFLAAPLSTAEPVAPSAAAVSVANEALTEHVVALGDRLAQVETDVAERIGLVDAEIVKLQKMILLLHETVGGAAYS